MATSIYDYVKMYGRKSVDTWRITILYRPYGRPLKEWSYIYDVPSDEFKRESGDGRIPDVVFDGIRNRPQAGQLAAGESRWIWNSVAVIGTRDPNDLDFGPDDRSNIRWFFVRVTRNGEQRTIKLPPRGSYQGSPLFDLDANTTWALTYDIMDDMMEIGQRRGEYIIEFVPVTWELVGIEWR